MLIISGQYTNFKRKKIKHEIAFRETLPTLSLKILANVVSIFSPKYSFVFNTDCLKDLREISFISE